MDIEKLLNDKDFMDRVATRFIKEREDRFNRNNAFRYSPTFDNMVAAINAKGGRIDSEGYGYFPEREKASAGWEQFNDAEIREMFDLCSDPESEFVDPLSLCWDMECPFPACWSRNSSAKNSGNTRFPADGRTPESAPSLNFTS